jgi:hypothetical protein
MYDPGGTMAVVITVAMVISTAVIVKPAGNINEEPRKIAEITGR